jgi:hypothetical protein
VYSVSETVTIQAEVSQITLRKGDWGQFDSIYNIMKIRGESFNNWVVKRALEAAIGLKPLQDNAPNAHGHWYETVNPKGILLHECNDGNIVKPTATRSGARCPNCGAKRKLP